MRKNENHRQYQTDEGLWALEKCNWKWSSQKAREESGIFFREYGYQEDSGRVFIVEEMESAESGKQFLAKNPNYVDEVGVDPSSLQVIVLEDWVALVS